MFCNLQGLDWINVEISLNDNVDNSQQNQEKVLLTEDPVGSIQIVID